MEVKPGYETLAAVLQRALDQAQKGKGAERHGNGLPFANQPMQTISGLIGSHHGLVFQAVKKATESLGLPAGRDVAELLGAINYLAGAVLWLEARGREVAQESHPEQTAALPVLCGQQAGETDLTAGLDWWRNRMEQGQ